MSTRWIAFLLATSLLVACGKSDQTPSRLATKADDPFAVQQAEMEKAVMDFSRVVVVRLKQDGKRVEVTSIMPLVVSEAKVSGQPAKTIFRVNAAGDGLVLFSRDILKGSAFRTEIKFSELQGKEALSFPVVQPNGSLQEHSFELEKIITPQ